MVSAAAYGLVVALATLGAATRAAASADTIWGCIPCSSCVTAGCWQTCRPNCGVPAPSNFIADGDVCRAQGQGFGPIASEAACRAARDACRGLLGAGAPTAVGGSIGITTLPQCANIALGSCQQAAAPGWTSRCASELANGYGSCSAGQFRAHYDHAAERECRQHAEQVTGVVPGTNQWAWQQPQPYVPIPVPQPWIIGSGNPGSAHGGAIIGSGNPHAGGEHEESKGLGAAEPPKSGNRRLLMLARRA